MHEVSLLDRSQRTASLHVRKRGFFRQALIRPRIAGLWNSSTWLMMHFHQRPHLSHQSTLLLVWIYRYIAWWSPLFLHVLHFPPMFFRSWLQRGITAFTHIEIGFDVFCLLVLAWPSFCSVCFGVRLRSFVWTVDFLGLFKGLSLFFEPRSWLDRVDDVIFHVVLSFRVSSGTLLL